MCKDASMPYFITNKDWYYYDDTEEKFKLTEKATKEAKESYKNFYKVEEE